MFSLWFFGQKSPKKWKWKFPFSSLLRTTFQSVVSIAVSLPRPNISLVAKGFWSTNSRMLKNVDQYWKEVNRRSLPADPFVERGWINYEANKNRISWWKCHCNKYILAHIFILIEIECLHTVSSIQSLAAIFLKRVISGSVDWAILCFGGVSQKHSVVLQDRARWFKGHWSSHKPKVVQALHILVEVPVIGRFVQSWPVGKVPTEGDNKLRLVRSYVFRKKKHKKAYDDKHNGCAIHYPVHLIYCSRSKPCNGSKRGAPGLGPTYFKARTANI